MEFTEWLRGGYPRGEAVSLTTLLRKGLPGSGHSRKWSFPNKAEHDKFIAARYKFELNPEDPVILAVERTKAEVKQKREAREQEQANQKVQTLD